MKGAYLILLMPRGAVYVSGEFALDFTGDDGPKGETFGPLEAPLKQYVQAQCKNGLLFASDQTGTRFQAFGGSRRKLSWFRLRAFLYGYSRECHT